MMMYLLLSVAGHLTILPTRTRGPWWSIRPARILLLAVVGTQTAATLICVFGFLVTPLWWGWAAMVSGYALAWFLVPDPIKLLTYRVLDDTKGAAAKPATVDAKLVSKPGTKIEATAHTQPTSEIATDAKQEQNADPKPQSEAVPAPASKPDAAAQPAPARGVKAPVPALANTPLRDIILAGVLKHPDDAGRIIAEGRRRRSLSSSRSFLSGERTM
jgi:H+-transporting ATPase